MLKSIPALKPKIMAIMGQKMAISVLLPYPLFYSWGVKQKFSKNYVNSTPLRMQEMAVLLFYSCFTLKLPPNSKSAKGGLFGSFTLPPPLYRGGESKTETPLGVKRK